MRVINRTLFILSIAGWVIFFCEINNITQYWAGVAFFLANIFITFAYAFTSEASAKVMSSDDETDKEIRKQQARVDMQNMDELYNQMLINEIIKSVK